MPRPVTPRPAPPTEIPAASADLTPAWLTAALRGSGAIGDARVTAVEREAFAAGHSATSQVLRLRLGYDAAEPGAPATLIAKLPAADPGVRAAISSAGHYGREVGFYAAFAAEDLPLPRCHFAAADPATGASLLLLEDLSEGHVGDNLGECSAAEADLAVAHLARFHARWWDQPRLADLPWLAPVDPDVFQQGCVRQWDPFLTKFGDRLPARLRAVGARAVGHAAAYRRWQTSQPRTLVHDDFRLDNLFFGRSGAARPLVIFDWQLCLVGRGIADVAYFAVCSLPIAQRRATERSLVDGYHAGLLAHGVRGYDYDRCWQDYRRAMLSALYRLIVAGGRLDYSSERGTALFRTAHRPDRQQSRRPRRRRPPARSG